MSFTKAIVCLFVCLFVCFVCFVCCNSLLWLKHCVPICRVNSQTMTWALRRLLLSLNSMRGNFAAVLVQNGAKPMMKQHWKSRATMAKPNKAPLFSRTVFTDHSIYILQHYDSSYFLVFSFCTFDSFPVLKRGNILTSKSETFYLPCTEVNKLKACPILVTTNLVSNKTLILYS